METVIAWLAKARDALDVAILQTDETRITLWSVLYLVFFVVLLFWAAAWLQRWLARGPLKRTKLDAGSRQAVATVVRYLLLLVGLLVILQSSGINLTTFHVFAGAIGIGVGFGLQNVVSNFISGLIIMFERPIKIGDRIVVDQVEGEVIEIGARATTVLTNDNIAILVPNSKFITENVVNWQYNDNNVRFRIPVGVAYGSDVEKVEKLLLDVAKENQDVLEDPPPAVRLLEFGDNGLAFELRVWSSSLVHRKGRLMSAINRAIYEKFNDAGIDFPFPQRDLHVRGGVLEVRQVERKD
jgi:small-conductance mechanosensitive channel